MFKKTPLQPGTCRVFVFNCRGTKTQVLLKSNGRIGAIHNVVKDCMVPRMIFSFAGYHPPESTK